MFVRLNKKIVLVFGVGFVTAIILFIGFSAVMGLVTTSKFCGTTCHEMIGVYQGWQASGHYINNSGTVTNCADCHLPGPQYYTTRLAVEVKEGMKNMVKHVAIEYDPNKVRTRVLASMPDSRCTRCHANLMAKPKSFASRIAHANSAWINKTDPNAQRCVDCHNVMHERKKTDANEKTK